jgi:hypothetical protein
MRRSRAWRSAALGGALPIALALAGSTVLAACGSVALTSGPPPGSPAASSIETPGSGEPTFVVPSGSLGPTVPVDAHLLEIFPTSVDGLPVQELPDVEATLVDDPDLLANAVSLASAAAVDGSTGAFVTVNVVRLKPGVFSEAFFRSWRDSYDRGACSQAGGVAGTAQASIGGRATFVDHCAAGVLTYHLRLADPDRLIALTALGEARLGEKLLEALRP